MKALRILILSAALCTLFILPRAASASGFEGKVKYMMTVDGGDSTTMVYQFKDGKTRIDVLTSTVGASMLFEKGSTKYVVLLDKQKLFMEHDMAGKELGGDTANIKVENTGKTETLLGHVCQIWTATSGDGTVAMMWIAPDIDAYFQLGRTAMSKTTDAGFKMLAKRGMFPLRMVRMKDGKEVSRTDAISIEPQSLDKTLFSIPEDFHGMGSHDYSR